MPEQTFVIDQLKFSYEGLFSISEVFNMVVGFFKERKYDWYEKVNQEQITPYGKQVRYVFEPWKSITDYYKIIVRMKIHFTDVKDVEVEHEGKVLHLQQGLVHIIIDAYVISDAGGAWASKPFYWLLVLLRDNYFHSQYYNKATRWVEKDVELLHKEIKNYFNVFNYSFNR